MSHTWSMGGLKYDKCPWNQFHGGEGVIMLSQVLQVVEGRRGKKLNWGL